MVQKIPTLYARLNDIDPETHLAIMNNLDKINALNFLHHTTKHVQIIAYLVWLILLSLSKHDKQMK